MLWACRFIFRKINKAWKVRERPVRGNARVGTRLSSRCGKLTMVKFTMSAKRKVKLREKDFEVRAATYSPAIRPTAFTVLGFLDDTDWI